jgi:hypothetical protein
MATSTWVSAARNWLSDNTGAQYKELSEKLAAIGLVKTADTGQINWATVSFNPTTGNQVAGYEIWRFNDALQSSFPIFFKLEYGTSTVGSSASWADCDQITVTVGTGSNGSGDITDIFSARQCFSGSYFSSNDTNDTGQRTSYLCHLPGYLGLGYKTLSGNNASSGLVIGRMPDANGAPTANGAYVYSGNRDNAALSIGMTNGAGLNYAVGSAAMCFVPANYSQAIGGVTQVFPHYVVDPMPKVLHTICTVNNGEVGAGTVFDATLVGTTTRTYVSIGMTMGYGSSFSGTSRGVALLWE